MKMKDAHLIRYLFGGSLRITGQKNDKDPVCQCGAAYAPILRLAERKDLRSLGAFSPFGRENSSDPCSGHSRSWSHCTGEGIPPASLFARTGAHVCWTSFHFRWRILGRSVSISCSRGPRHPDRQRIHDRRTQNESYLLPRLQCGGPGSSDSFR
jgi:hypothetical protein